ncbi:hypothetical protein H1R20_g750, partial [Candolleomyces eurysporus]
MPRPKIHKNKAEVKKAKAANSLRYYEKKERGYRIELLLGFARTLPGKLDRLMGGSSRAYFNCLCERHHSDLVHNGRTMALEVVEARLAKLKAIHSELGPWRDEVLNLAGYTEEYKEMEAIGKNIYMHIIWMEELEYLADVEPENLFKNYMEHTLLYQRELPKDNSM